MFFSARQFTQFLNANPVTRARVLQNINNDRRRYNQQPLATLTVKEIARRVAAAKRGIVARDVHNSRDFLGGYLYKWWRPWEVVPELANFSAPAGEYAFGIEVEIGFLSLNASRRMASAIRNWRNIAIDHEGGMYPLEVTFPPIVESKLTSRSAPFRYLKLLGRPESEVFRHLASAQVGTHINVSRGFDQNSPTRDMVQRALAIVDEVIFNFSREESTIYFGRVPYGRCYLQHSPDGNRFWIELKLFNTTTDIQKFKDYLKVAKVIASYILDDRKASRIVRMSRHDLKNLLIQDLDLALGRAGASTAAA